MFCVVPVTQFSPPFGLNKLTGFGGSVTFIPASLASRFVLSATSLTRTLNWLVNTFGNVHA
jgi:hypothetical protein